MSNANGAAKASKSLWQSGVFRKLKIKSFGSHLASFIVRFALDTKGKPRDNENVLHCSSLIKIVEALVYRRGLPGTPRLSVPRLIKKLGRQVSSAYEGKFCAREAVVSRMTGQTTVLPWPPALWRWR